MNSELTFRLSLAVIGGIIYAIRFYYFGTAGSNRKSVLFSRLDRGRMLLISGVGLMAMVVPITYILMPYWLQWAALSMAAIWRWMGVGLLLLSALLLFRVHRALGKNYDTPGFIKKNQTLITSGPYRWVRHPMYVAFLLSGLATFLISSNWFVGLIFLIYCSTAIAMVGVEERTLLEKFGDEYLAYMKRTGRFWPRLLEEPKK